MDAGASAPFYGVLVPEFQYRQMSADIIEKDLLRAQLSEEIKPESSFDWTTFLGGTLLGALSVIMIEHKGGSKF